MTADKQPDIARLRFESYDPVMVIAEELEFGLRELDPPDSGLRAARPGPLSREATHLA